MCSLFFENLRGLESRYVSSGVDEDGGDGEDDEETTKSGEGLQNSEWYDWTNNIVVLSEKLRRDVDQVTDMPYASFLFWMNFFKLKAEDEYRSMRKH